MSKARNAAVAAALAASMTVSACESTGGFGDMGDIASSENIGTVIGAILGGYAGNRLGGDNKTVGTVLGAVLGGYLGRVIGWQADQKRRGIYGQCHRQCGGIGHGPVLEQPRIRAFWYRHTRRHTHGQRPKMHQFQPNRDRRWANRQWQCGGLRDA